MNIIANRRGWIVFAAVGFIGIAGPPSAHAADAGGPTGISAQAPSTAVPGGVWQAVPNLKAAELGRSVPKLRAYRTYRVDLPALAALLDGAATREKRAATEVELTLPMPDGTYARFAVVESALFSPAVQARFPDIRTYRGQGIDDRSATAMIELSPFGFRAYVIADDETAVIDPAGDGTHYLSYWKKNAISEPFSCSMHGDEASVGDVLPHLRAAKARPNGGTLRTYRFAATLTGEYTTFFAALSCPAGSPANCPQNAAAAAMVHIVLARAMLRRGSSCTASRHRPHRRRKSSLKRDSPQSLAQ